MDDQHNYPTDDAEKLRSILLQMDEVGRQEVYGMIRELAVKAGVQHGYPLPLTFP